MVAVLAAVVVIAVYPHALTWLGLGRRTTTPPPATGTMTYDQDTARVPGLLGVDPEGGTGALLLLNQGDEALSTEPAGLPTPPRGRRVSGFRRTAAGAGEDVAFWRIDGASVDETMAFYVHAAREAGFTALPVAGGDATAGTTVGSTPATPRPASRLFVRGAGSAMDQVLTVRVTPRSAAAGPGAGAAGVRVVVWLRYPIASER